MTERAIPTHPPLILDQGRFLIHADGEYQAFYGPKMCSWTTGTLNSDDLAALREYLPVLEDNAMELWKDSK